MKIIGISIILTYIAMASAGRPGRPGAPGGGIVAGRPFPGRPGREDPILRCLRLRRSSERLRCYRALLGVRDVSEAEETDAEGGANSVEEGASPAQSDGGEGGEDSDLAGFNANQLYAMNAEEANEGNAVEAIDGAEEALDANAVDAVEGADQFGFGFGPCRFLPPWQRRYCWRRRNFWNRCRFLPPWRRQFCMRRWVPGWNPGWGFGADGPLALETVDNGQPTTCTKVPTQTEISPTMETMPEEVSMPPMERAETAPESDLIKVVVKRRRGKPCKRVRRVVRELTTMPEEPAAEEPEVEEPEVEEPEVEERAAEQPEAELPAAEEPAAEMPEVEEAEEAPMVPVSRPGRICPQFCTAQGCPPAPVPAQSCPAPAQEERAAVGDMGDETGAGEEMGDETGAGEEMEMPETAPTPTCPKKRHGGPVVVIIPTVKVSTGQTGIYGKMKRCLGMN